MVGGAAVTFKGTHVEGDMRAGSACTKLSVFKKKKRAVTRPALAFTSQLIPPTEGGRGMALLIMCKKTTTKKKTTQEAKYKLFIITT